MSIDYRNRSVFKFPKGKLRADEKRERLAKERVEDTAARDLAWDRCKGKCEQCGRRVTRGGGLIYGAHFHHVVFRSHGGRKRPQYLVLCAKCHLEGEHGNRRKRR